MRKLKLFIFFSLIKIIALNGEQIYVAPILFIDENEERYEADENFLNDLTHELKEKKEEAKKVELNDIEIKYYEE